MSFATLQSGISKKPITYIEIDLDKCTRTFGVAPCVATGTKCYNTFATCTDKTNFDNAASVTTYKFCNATADNATIGILNARPYLVNREYLATEIKEDKTITARITLQFLDEKDFDIGIDPYWADRNLTIAAVPGSFWKKLIARNPYYKGRTLRIYEGFAGLAATDYVKRFEGKIENITRDGAGVKIECVDEIADLSKINYPFKTNCKLAADVPAVFDCNNQADMLKCAATNYDYALRRDFVFMPLTDASSINPASELLDDWVYYYQVVAFNALAQPLASSRVYDFDTTTYNDITLSWAAVAGASYYRVYGRNNTTDYYLQTTNLTIQDWGQLSFGSAGSAPNQAIRYFQFIGTDPADLNNWTLLSGAFTITLNSVAGLDASGYLKIDDEVIYYAAISTLTLTGVERIMYKTKGLKHYTGTNVKSVLAEAAANPFALLKKMYTSAGIATAKVDTTTINALQSAYSGINFSCKPLIKETTADKLIFDLCWVLDVKQWVNEDGLLTVKYNSVETVDFAITDATNIILNTKTVDFNADEIKTRMLLYYDHYDLLKALSDKDSFAKLHIEIDGDAESAYMYNKQLTMERTTAWINEDCGTAAAVTSYVAALMNGKLQRARVMRPILNFDVELKDGEIKTGHIVSLATDAFNDVDGYDFAGEKAEVIKKNLKDGKVNLAVRLLATDTITTTTEDHTNTLDAPVRVNELNFNEVKVTGLSYLNNSGTRIYTISGSVDASNGVVLCWDNMHVSNEETATDIAGTTKSLPTMITNTGVESINTNAWRTVRKYNVYMFVADETAVVKTSSVGRPNASDANGVWYLVGIVPDLKSTDTNKFYQYRHMFKMEMVGRVVGFDVYADASLVYDETKAVGLAIPFEQ
jgi:hypothetical protein